MSGVRNAVAVAVTLGLAGAAHAQQTAEPGNSADSAGGSPSLDEITVTGSRIRRTTDFDTANPTTVVDSDFLKNLGIVNVGQAIEQLPSNVSTFSATNTGNSSFFAGSTIANLRGLNPFFGSRTLNLLNSRRFVPTNQGDGVDLNFIPSVLIERVDVVTGGASAAYGSGAISGVNNIFLNRKLEGGRADVDYGESGESDAEDRHVGLAYGMGLMDDRAHFTVAYEYEKSDAVGCLDARDWCRKSVGFYQDPATGGLILGSNVRRNQISTTGVLVGAPGATTTLQADASGTGTSVFNIGNGGAASATGPGAVFNNVVGGDGDSVYNYTNLRAPVKRNVAAGTFTFNVTDDTHLSVDLSWGKVDTDNRSGALASQFAQVNGDNPYLQANSGLYNAIGGTATSVGFIDKDWSDQVDSHSAVTTDVKRAAVGLDGKFGASSWGWDGYYQYGKTSREQLVADNLHLNQYLMALDAVKDASGNTVCRVTRDGFATAIATGGGAYATADPILANGCVPINPFGTQQLTAAQQAYSFGNLDEKLDYKQQVFALNSSGDLFAGFGAGPIQGAIGGEYRVEEGNNIAEVPPGTTDQTRTDYLIQYGDSFAGKVKVTEGYLETNIPFLKDAPAAKRLELDLAARESHYRNEGGFGTTGETRTHSFATWKASGLWDPVDWLRFRGSQSRDSRAANFRELYYGQNIAAGGSFGYCGPGGSFHVDPCSWSLEGNVNLKPEKSDTTTFGFVVTPKDLLAGFQFAADYFRIRISDAIEQASVTGTLNGCRINNDPAACALLVSDGTTYTFNGVTYAGYSGLRALSFNGAGYIFKGIDFTSSYLWQVNETNALSFRLLATHMIDQKFKSLATDPYTNVVGQTGTGNSFLSDNQPTAKWNANLSATWTHGPLALTGQARFVSAGEMDYNGITSGTPAAGTQQRLLSDNHVPSYQVFALAGNYTFDNVGPLRTLQVWALIDNLFDRDPPVAVGGGAFGPSNNYGGTNPVFFDTLGRTFKLGIRTQF
jgi:iron complex outermembrane receptor protein